MRAFVRVELCREAGEETKVKWPLGPRLARRSLPRIHRRELARGTARKSSNLSVEKQVSVTKRGESGVLAPHCSFPEGTLE